MTNQPDPSVEAVVVAHYRKGEANPTYYLFGESVRLFIVDENQPGDRVYEWLSRDPVEKLTELIPEGSPAFSPKQNRPRVAEVRRGGPLWKGRRRLILLREHVDSVAR